MYFDDILLCRKYGLDVTPVDTSHIFHTLTNLIQSEIKIMNKFVYQKSR